MGYLVWHSPAPEFDFTVALRLDIDDNANGAGITTERFRGIDVVVISRCRLLVLHDIERLASIGVNVVVGTTGWTEQMHRAKSEVEKGGIGLVWSPNFSIGVNIFLQIVAEDTPRRMAPYPEYGAGAWEIHHAAKKDAPSGTLLRTGCFDEEGRSKSPCGCQRKPRRRAYGNARNRIRLPG